MKRAEEDGPFRPIPRRDGLPNRVKRQLLDMITAQVLTPGSRLPSERALATRLAVSRNVVREAVQSLVDMNVLDRRQGSGIYVRDLDVESLIEPLGFVVALDKSTLRTLHEARLVIEPGIAALAAKHCASDSAEKLARFVETSRQVVDSDVARFLEIDIDLHATLLEIAGNPFLSRIMDSLRELGRSSRGVTNSVHEMRHVTQRDHERIVAAVIKQDCQGARDAMRDHLIHVSKTLDALSNVQDSEAGTEIPMTETLQ